MLVGLFSMLYLDTPGVVGFDVFIHLVAAKCRGLMCLLGSNYTLVEDHVPFVLLVSFPPFPLCCLPFGDNNWIYLN